MHLRNIPEEAFSCHKAALTSKKLDCEAQNQYRFVDSQRGFEDALYWAQQRCHAEDRRFIARLLLELGTTYFDVGKWTDGIMKFNESLASTRRANFDSSHFSEMQEFYHVCI